MATAHHGLVNYVLCKTAGKFILESTDSLFKRTDEQAGRGNFQLLCTSPPSSRSVMVKGPQCHRTEVQVGHMQNESQTVYRCSNTVDRITLRLIVRKIGRCHVK